MAVRLRFVMVAILHAFLFAGTHAHAGEADAVTAAVAPFFRPIQSSVAALDPSGRYAAYDLRGEDGLSIVVFDIADASSQRYVIAEGVRRRSGVAQLHWMSSTELVFSLHSRDVGVIDTSGRRVRSLISSRDLSRFMPDPQVGPRREMRIPTPDMPADGSRLFPEATLVPRVDVESAIIDAMVFADLFDEDSLYSTSRALVPFLRGNSSTDGRFLLEVRMNRDPLDDYTDEIRRVTLPGGTILSELPPSDGDFADTSGYGRYDVTRPLPPALLLELDPATKRERVLQERTDWLRILTDHEGQPRLGLAAQRDRRQYFYRPIKSRKWLPLDKAVKEARPHQFTVRAEQMLGARSVPLGFDHDGTTLYYASNLDHDAFALHALDMSTGLSKDAVVAVTGADLIEPTDLVREDVLVFDPHQRRLVGIRFGGVVNATFWFDGDLAQLESTLNARFSPRRCTIRQWDASRQRFLIDIAGPADPGGHYLFDLENNKLFALAERAPWITDLVSESHPFAFATEDGRRHVGMITLPRQPRLEPAPVLVYFHDGPWFCDAPKYNAGVQALAALGFAVMQLNHRGSAGLGRAHLEAVKHGWDAAVIDDVEAALDWVAAKHPVNPRMVAAFGNGYGGYMAVRSVQVDPARFRCAVAINAPYDPHVWAAGFAEGQHFRTRMRRAFFGTENEPLGARSALEAAKTTTRPVLVVHAEENAYVPVIMGRALYRALKRSVDETAYLELRGEGHGGWSDESTEKLFAELGRFFNATIYNYSVEVGPATVDPAE